MPDDARSDKRRLEREQIKIAVTLVIGSNEAEYFATTVDVSPYGLRLQSNVRLAPSQPVGLLLGTEPACFLNGRVAWVGKADSAQAGQAGFEFSNPLTGRVGGSSKRSHPGF
jgi:hypothetical protein